MVVFCQAIECWATKRHIDDVAHMMCRCCGIVRPSTVKQKTDLVEMLQLRTYRGGDLCHVTTLCTLGKGDGALFLSFVIGQLSDERSCGSQFHVGRYPLAEHRLSLLVGVNTNVEVLWIIGEEHLAYILSNDVAILAHLNDAILEVGKIIVGHNFLWFFSWIVSIIVITVFTSNEVESQ